MEQSLRTLFVKYLEDSCSEQEILLLLEYFKVSADTSELSRLIMNELSQEEILKTHITNVDQRLDAVYANVRLHIDQDTKPSVRKIRLWPRIAVAASIALIFATGGYLFFSIQKKKTEQTSVYANDVAPGKNTATLTLANGKKIILSDVTNGDLVKEDGIRISKTADDQIVYETKDAATASSKINVLSTARGETYQVRLPDGTNVSLNAGSSLKYPASFASFKTRSVELTGEAYFEVFKDKAHPFIVKTYNQEVEVLGTHFNINAYTDENGTTTTLLEGSVKVSGPSASKILSPGEQSILNGDQFAIAKANTEEVTAWKNGDFNFNGEDIKSIMRQLARWYDIDTDYQGKVTKELYYAKISRNKNISAVLKLLEQAEGVHFNIEGRRIIVMQ